MPDYLFKQTNNRIIITFKFATCILSPCSLFGTHFFISYFSVAGRCVADEQCMGFSFDTQWPEINTIDTTIRSKYVSSDVAPEKKKKHQPNIFNKFHFFVFGIQFQFGFCATTKKKTANWLQFIWFIVNFTLLCVTNFFFVSEKNGHCLFFFFVGQC